MELVVLGTILAVSNVMWAFFWNRERWRRKELERPNPNYAQVMAVVHDLNRLSGGLVEIRRVDPSSVFLYSPK